MILLSIGLIVSYVSELITNTTKHGVSTQLGLITFLCGVVYVGMKLMGVKLREMTAMREIKEEQLILSKAKAAGGSLTMSQAALECKLRIADTKKTFERLALTGICRIDVTESGELFYRFPTFETPETAPGLLNIEKQFDLKLQG